MRQRYEVVGYRGKSGKLGAYKCVWQGKTKDGSQRAKLRSFDGKLEFFVDASKLEAVPAPKDPCAECNERAGKHMLPDSSGITAKVCDRCASLSQFERSYA